MPPVGARGRRPAARRRRSCGPTRPCAGGKLQAADGGRSLTAPPTETWFPWPLPRPPRSCQLRPPITCTCAVCPLPLHPGPTPLQPVAAPTNLLWQPPCRRAARRLSGPVSCAKQEPLPSAPGRNLNSWQDSGGRTDPAASLRRAPGRLRPHHGRGLSQPGPPPWCYCRGRS